MKIRIETGNSLFLLLTLISRASSTNSIASSILDYRTIQGRTFHSDRHNINYFTPNDEQQVQSIDIRYVSYSPMSHSSMVQRRDLRHRSSCLV